MIIIKSDAEIHKIREAGKIVAETHELIRQAIAPGISTLELDRLAEKNIRAHKAAASFKGYGGFSGSICASPNEVVIHGIPSADVILQEGDILSIDIGACLNGYHADAAKTHPVGKVSAADQALIDVTRECFYKGIAFAHIGNRLSDISHSVEQWALAHGYAVVKEFVGHGVGTQLHEDPQIPNYGPPGHGPRLREGMVLAVEPMVNAGTEEIRVLKDGWTTVTQDRKKSAHYEHTIAITANGPILLTAL